jgi:uncharacterized repeat protein (TIGR03803 family)
MTRLRSLGIACVLSAFCVATTASYAQTFTKLVDFNDANGGDPQPALIQASDGNYYGVTQEGGANRAGVSGAVFQLTPAGVESVFYSFCSLPKCADGYSPSGGLVEGSDGNLYGTTTDGGAFNDGTVFKLTLGGVLTTLHSFNKTKGANPASPLVEAPNGDFYGTTPQGGTNSFGTIFKITTAGALTVLHNFAGTDGEYPNGGLFRAANGNFYGATVLGGTGTSCSGGGCGTIYRMSPTGTVTTLHSFNATDGSSPLATLILAKNGAFYGTASAGGNLTCKSPSGGCGTVFKITTAGVLTTLHEFDTTDGLTPVSGVIQATDGNFYGTTTGGGANGDGTIYRITAAGKLTTLHSFDGTDGSDPIAGLIQGSDGSFYGTAYTGGASDFGTAFSLSVGLAPAKE